MYILNARYHIRLIQQDDLQQYFDLIERNRLRLEDFFAGTVELTRNLADTQKHLNDIIDKCARKEFYSFVVIDMDENKMIASLQIKSLDWRIPKGEIGYYIDAAYEGKGIITQAVAKIVEYGFHELGLKKLFIRASAANKGSVLVAEKNGFEKEGILRMDYKTTSGKLVDLTYFGLIYKESEC